MFEATRADLLRAQGGPWEGPLRAVHTLANSYGLQALLVYRLGRWLREARRRPRRWLAVPLLWPAYRLLLAWVRAAYDIRIETSADLGPGLIIHHFGGIRLRACRLGANCVIHHEVQLEPAADDGPGPQLGDRVWIGPHARISGPTRVGSGATVGAGAVVAQDVPANAMVLGNPARVARLDYDNSGLP